MIWSSLAPKEKFINSIWKLNLIPKVKFFAWKLIHNILLTGDRLRQFGINITCDYPFRNKEVEIINHIFVRYDLTNNILLLIIIPVPINSNQHVIDWLKNFCSEKRV